jgi:hypothetical protein
MNRFLAQVSLHQLLVEDMEIFVVEECINPPLKGQQLINSALHRLALILMFH